MPPQPSIVSSVPPQPPPVSGTRTCNVLFYIVFFLVELVLIGLFPLHSYGYSYAANSMPYAITSYNVQGFYWDYYVNYKFLYDVSVMMLVGYGFLIVYLKFHRWMSLGLTFFVAMISMQHYVFWYALWDKSFAGSWWSATYPQNRYNWMWLATMNATLKAAIAVIISMGALVGKVDAFQMLIMALFETIAYPLQEFLLFRAIGVRDIGGCFYIHMFAAFWGICASWIYSPKSNASDNPNNRAGYCSGTLTFVGTFFLWIFFPSFNAYNQVMLGNFSRTYTHTTAPFYTDLMSTKYLCIMNTFWALTSSTICAIWLSMILNQGKIRIEHVLNATLSGGVLVAACCDMFAMPYPPLICGAFAGIISVLSFQYLGPALQYCGIFDTRGILSLHLIPSIFGAIASAIAVSTLDRYWFWDSTVPSIDFLYYPTGTRMSYQQGGYQIIGALVSAGFGIGGGIIAGILLRIWRCYNVPEDTFGDHVFFKMIQEEANTMPMNPPLVPPSTVPIIPSNMGNVVTSDRLI